MVHWARVVLNQRTAALVEGMDVSTMDALELSGTHWQHARVWRSYTTVQFPEFDICRDLLYDRAFDIVFAEQVFEHVTYPYRAVRNVYRMLRDGGYFLLTLPFLLKIHNMPEDCTRWTPQGLRYFLEEAGFDRSAIIVDSWGNRSCVVANFDTWAEFEPGVHSLDNEPDFPVVVWALARKQTSR